MQERVAPFGATADQKKWLDNESERTGNSQASIMRDLIQEKIVYQEVTFSHPAFKSDIVITKQVNTGED